MRGALEAALVAAANAPSKTGRGIAVPHYRDVEAIWSALEAALAARSEPDAEGLDALLDIRHEEDDSWSVSIRACLVTSGAAMTLSQAFIEANDAAEAWVGALRDTDLAETEAKP